MNITECHPKVCQRKADQAQFRFHEPKAKRSSLFWLLSKGLIPTILNKIERGMLLPLIPGPMFFTGV